MVRLYPSHPGFVTTNSKPAQPMPSVLALSLPFLPLMLTLFTQSFFGALGCACAIIFTVFGASYGTAKSAGAIFSSGVIRPDRLMQNT